MTTPATMSKTRQAIQNSKPIRALIVVAKYPAAGQTKTRLTPPLSPEQAAVLFECFVQDTLVLIRQVPGMRRIIAYFPAEARAYFTRLAPDFELIQQQGSELGVRLDNAVSHYLQLGCEQVVIMDSDSPTLPVSSLRTAFERLAGPADVVLGPCDDGGYYLIGLKKAAPRLFRDVPMSTSHVLADTVALARQEGLQVELLPPWYDVDDVAMLARLTAELAHAPVSIASHTRAFFAANRDILRTLETYR